MTRAPSHARPGRVPETPGWKIVLYLGTLFGTAAGAWALLFGGVWLAWVAGVYVVIVASLLVGLVVAVLVGTIAVKRGWRPGALLIVAVAAIVGVVGWVVR